MGGSNRPSRLTVIGAAVGAFALTAATVAAVATTDEEPAGDTSAASATVEQDPSRGEAPATGAPRGSGGATTPMPHRSATSEPSAGDDDDDDAGDAQRPSVGTGQQITQDEAVAIAEQALAEMGTVPPLREVDLDHGDGLTVWELEFGADHEVEVDASSGQIVKLERYDD